MEKTERSETMTLKDATIEDLRKELSKRMPVECRAGRHGPWEECDWDQEGFRTKLKCVKCGHIISDTEYRNIVDRAYGRR